VTYTLIIVVKYLLQNREMSNQEEGNWSCRSIWWWYYARW